MVDSRRSPSVLLRFRILLLAYRAAVTEVGVVDGFATRAEVYEFHRILLSKGERISYPKGAWCYDSTTSRANCLESCSRLRRSW